MNFREIVRINEELLRSNIELATRTIATRRGECENPDAGMLASGFYATWLSELELICWLDYAVDQDPDRLRLNVAEAVRQRIPLARKIIANREKHLLDVADGYDPCAVADYRLAPLLCLYVALHSKTENIELCRATNYGRYRGASLLNNHQSIVCRMARAYLFSDIDWLSEEVDSLKHLAVGKDLNFEFQIPRSKWHSIFYSLFFGDENEFTKNARWLASWFRKRLLKRGQITHPSHNETRYPPGPGEEKFTPPGLLINLVLLMAVKIAIAYRGYEIDWDDPFAPKNLINES